MTDPKRCPICGKDNRCAQADSLGGVKSCWCFSEKIPQALLDKVPEDQRFKACICKACIQGFKEQEIRDRRSG